MKIFYRFLLIIAFISPLKAGGFEDLGNSARVVSLGGAFVAVADAPYSLFYNPAGIYNISNLSISTSYSNLYPGLQDENLNYYSLSSVIPMGIVGKIGVGGTFFKTGLWQENIFVGTYAREIYKTFSVGANVKVLRWAAEPAPGEAGLSYLGFTFDAGIHYTLKDIFNNSDLRLGAAVQNITEPSIAVNGSDDAKLPMIITGGFAFVSNTYHYLIAVDVAKEKDDLYIKSGAEFLGLRQDVLGLNTGFLIRVGYNSILKTDTYRESGLAGGFGLEVEKLTIDYAYVLPLELQHVGGSHKISLSYNF